MDVPDGGGGRGEVTGRLQRTLLAILAANGRDWTSQQALTSALWPADRTDLNFESRLHVLIHRLRAKVGGDTIAHGEHGYRLDPSVDVDVWAFDRAINQAMLDHYRADRSGVALEHLEDALTLWQGVPFMGIDAQQVVAERERLIELHVSGQEARFQHLLDRGDHVAVLADAPGLARAHPLRERLHALWITALLRAGDRAQALRVHDALGDRLADVLDVAPGRELAELRRLVAHGPSVAPTVRRREAAPPQDQRTQAENWAMAGRLSDALRLFGQAEVHCRANGLGDEHALVLRSMAVVNCEIGDLHRAARLAEEARDAATAPELSDLLRTTEALIRIHMHRANEAAAVLPRHEPTGSVAVLWWRTRSQLLRRQGRHQDSVAAARAAERLSAAGVGGVRRALVHVDLGSSLRDAGDRSCIRWYRSALDIAQSAEARPLMALAHAALARAWLQFDEPERAIVHGRESLQIARSCGAWGIAGRAAVRLGDAADQMGESMRAAWYRTEGLSHYRRVDYPVPLQERDRLEQLVATAESAATERSAQAQATTA